MHKLIICIICGNKRDNACEKLNKYKKYSHLEKS